jgi:hypothetical protein
VKSLPCNVHSVAVRGVLYTGIDTCSETQDDRLKRWTWFSLNIINCNNFIGRMLYAVSCFLGREHLVKVTYCVHGTVR